MRSHAWEGLNLPSNLITVCGSGTMGCHARIHAHPKESYAKGWLVSAYNDHPENVPVFSEYRNREFLVNYRDDERRGLDVGVTPATLL